MAQMEEVLTDLTGLLAAHCFLLLATCVHAAPSLHPFDYLLWVMDAIALFFLGSASFRCLRYLGEAPDTATEAIACGATVAASTAFSS